jgi:homoserine acetyltransferase
MSTWFTGRTAEMIGLFGSGKLIDTSKYDVVAIDSLGNGISSSPSNSKLQSRMKFPKFSISDVVNSEYKLLTGVLAIHHVRAIAGSSSIGAKRLYSARLIGAEVLELHSECGQVLSNCDADKVNSAVAEFLERK